MLKKFFHLIIVVILSSSFNLAQQYYAVLITGDTPEGYAQSPKNYNGGDMYSGYDEFWNDTFLMWELLHNYGFADDHIYVLYGYGNDYQSQNPRYRHPNFPSQQITSFSAYISDVQNIFNWLANGNTSYNIPKLTNNDILFIWTFDHGTSSGGHSALCLMDGIMWDYDFASYVNPISCQKRIILMQQCRSGGFIDDLQDSKTVILTACSSTEEAWRADDISPDGSDSNENELYNGSYYHHGEFNYHVINAFNTKTIIGNSISSDIDNNGGISVLESKTWEFNHDSRYASGVSHPQYSDQGSLGSASFVYRLMDLAYTNKSVNQTATGQNNGRNLVRDNSGNYHLIFASDGEIFYHKMTAGNTWLTPIRLSTGNGNNNYPSISQSGGRIYVTWQRNASGNNYDIYFAASPNGGTSWNTRYILNSVTTTTEPLPSIQAASSYEMVVFCYGSGIKSYWSYYTTPYNQYYWTIRTVGFSTSYSPTITSAYQSPTYYFPLAIANSSDNHIYYYYFNPSTTYWNGGPNNLSSIVPGSNAVHITPSITSIPGTSQIHVAWKKLIGSGSSIYDYLIIHRKSTNYYSWPNEWFGTYYCSQENPSITALATNKVDLLYHSPSQFGTQYVYKMRFNGSSWSSPTSIASNGRYPSVSSGSTTGKYVWTSGSSLPYTVMLSSETLQKELEINPLDYYSRSIAWLDSSGSFLEVRLHPIYLKMNDGTEQRIDIIPASLDTFNLTQENSFNLLSSVPFQIPANTEEIVFDYSISAEGIDNVLDNRIDKLQPTFNLVNNSEEILTTSTESYSINSGRLEETRQQFAMSVNEIDNKQVLQAAIRLNGLIPKKGTFASLGHIFDYTTLETKENEGKIAISETEQIKELSIQNYPNPFNPITIIRYQMPKDEFVTLRVYDILGREITTLVNEEKPAGTYSVNFNASNLASGIYFYKISAGNFSQTKKMLLLR